MKIAIPIVSPNGMLSEINEHFGMTEDFAILDMENNTVKSVNSLHHGPGSGKTPAQLLVDNDIRIVFAGAIGPHMLTILLGAGVRVFKGAVGTVEDAVEDYKAGYLTEVHNPGEMDDL